jgi:hypothetical protein
MRLTMRLPRVRFTVRRLMVAVAVAAIVFAACIWMHTRAVRFRRAAQSYREQLTEYMRRPTARRRGHHIPDRRVVRYYVGMAEKYEYAGRHPWLPVAPDPPEP